MLLFKLILINYIIIFTKNIISYTEELFLFTTYIILFIVIFELSSSVIRTALIQNSFNLIEFYEKLIYFKLKLNLNLILIYRTLLNNEFLQYYIKNINIYFMHKAYKLNTIITKIKNNLLFYYFSYYSIQFIKIETELN